MISSRLKRTLGGIAVILMLAVPTGGVHAATMGTTGGTDTLTITAGTSTITGASPGAFVATLTGSDQQVYSTLTNFTAADLSGTGTGWNVTFQATQFACTVADTGCPAAGDSLPVGSLLIAAPTVACHTGTSCSGRAAKPAISISSNTAVDATTAVKVASSVANTGMGTYDFTPGAVTTGKQLQLTVPSTAYATTYHSTLTVSMISGP